MKPQRRRPPEMGERIEFYARAGKVLDWSNKVTATIVSAAPRASHWWVRPYGQRDFVEVYRRESSWFESPTPGAPATPRRRKPKPVPPGSVMLPMFEGDPFEVLRAVTFS